MHAHFETKGSRVTTSMVRRVYRPDIGDAIGELAHLVSNAVRRRDVVTLRSALADLERVSRVLRHKIGRGADPISILVSQNDNAGKRDPAGSRLADQARTPECVHPPASELVTLACDDCGVFILNGLVIDTGRRAKGQRRR